MGVSIDIPNPASNKCFDLPSGFCVPDNEVLIGKFVPCQFGLLSKLVIFRECGEDTLGPQIGRVAFGPLRISDNKGHIQLKLANGYCVVGCFALDEIDVNARIFPIIATE